MCSETRYPGSSNSSNNNNNNSSSSSSTTLFRFSFSGVFLLELNIRKKGTRIIGVTGEPRRSHKCGLKLFGGG